MTGAILILPAIAEFGCTLLFAAFDQVLEFGISLLPGFGVGINAGLRVLIQAVNFVSESGQVASAFQSWYFEICGAGKYAELAVSLSNPLSLVPSCGGG